MPAHARLAFRVFSLPCVCVLRGFPFCLACIAGASVCLAEPLSRKTDIDFFRDVPSRNLKGLASRSDGRLVGGPSLREIATAAPAELLWCIAPTDQPNRFLLGTGPDGKIVEITLDADHASFTASEIARLDDPQIFALTRLPDGAILAGTSPKGALCLVRDGKTVARALLPVDSIFDFVLVDEHTALAATGNPARIYRIDLPKFATVGLIADKITDTKILAERGITLFGEVRDRNVRRIAALPDGRIAAGSSPKGNVYTFPREGGAPFLLQENRDAEITDLLPQPNGDLFAAIVFSATSGESRIGPPGGTRNPKPEILEPPPPAQVEKFGGRSSVLWFPANGFPETLTTRNGTAFYRLARFGDTLLIAGGEQGELAGYDLQNRLSLTFAGSVSAQVNGLLPLPRHPGGDAAPQFLLLRNNAPGLAVLDFAAAGEREAETRRIDLGTLSTLGALRIDRLREVAARDLAVDVRVSNGSDDVEGWGPWTNLTLSPDGGWRSAALRGRYARVRLRVNDRLTEASPANASAPARPAASPAPVPALPKALEIDRGSLFALPQNRRPQLQDFRVLTPNFGLIPAAEQPPPATTSLSQLTQGGARDEDSRRRSNFLSSQVVPSPGAQVVLWTVTDPDNDTFLCTFSVRRDGDNAWTEIAANTQDGYAQFDTSHLPDGIYFTRLVATETSPRPAAERLSQNFETDDLVIDHTAPEIVSASARRNGEFVSVSVAGRDRLSLLDGIEVIFNNGTREVVEQPADGVRDGREEAFTLDLPIARVSNATSVEVTLYDAAGNGAARRLTW
jgi:hypothetical protein